MFFHRRTIPGLAIHSYLIGDEKSHECIVIDPVRNVDEYIQIAKDQSLKIKYILESHVHADFVSGSKDLKKKLQGNPAIYCSGMGGEEWVPAYVDHVVKDGDEIKIGNLSLKAVHTPGHTPEHLMWELRENDELIKLFTGDFLFVGSVGRPDLLGENEKKKLAEQLYESVFNILKNYPDEVEIRPAHGAGSLCGKGMGTHPYSVLGLERKNNDSLIKTSKEEWIQKLMEDMPPAPKYFHRMKEVNVQGPESFEETLSPLHPSEVKKEVEKEAFILDVRTKEAFASAHIPNSINIANSPHLSTWAGWTLSYEKPLILVMDDEKDLEEVTQALLRVGFTDIKGYLKGGVTAWEKAGFPISRLGTLTAAELHESLKGNQPFFVLDVRTDSEWNEGHIKDAHHIHGGLVVEHLDQIPRDQHIAVTCGSGYRASIVASLLKREGFKNISNVLGGMTAWKNEGYPMIK